jgi:hypothetical protein
MHEVFADTLGVPLVNYSRVKPLETPTELGEDSFPVAPPKCQLNLLELMANDIQKSVQSYE